MSLQNRFYKLLLSSGCIPIGSHVLVAVSGGADSVALLSLLHQVSEALKLHLEAAHLDHALRSTSCEDARFVEHLCLSLAVPLTRERRDVAAIARECGGNLEEVAREERRDFLLTTALTRNCTLVALGHHADDQAETFLLRLLRGSGTTGLAGMSVVNGKMVRPLLSFSRADLAAYLEQEGIAWREDESNHDHSFTRNRIRHHLLPILESYNPNICRLLSGLCEQMRDDDDLWSVLVAQEFSRCCKNQGDEVVMDRLLTLELAPALIGRVARAAIKQVRGDLRGMTSAHVAAVLRLIAAGPPQGELSLPGLWVARRYEKLIFRRAKFEIVKPFSLELTGVGDYALPEGRTLRITLEHGPIGESQTEAEFAASGLSFPLQLRYSKPGDRLRPSGMSGTKKLQDLFVDLKLTKEERQKSLLLLHNSKVLWVVGLRRSDAHCPSMNGQVLRIVLEPAI